MSLTPDYAFAVDLSELSFVAYLAQHTPCNWLLSWEVRIKDNLF